MSWQQHDVLRRLLNSLFSAYCPARLSSACAADKQLFCRDVRPGSAAVLRCLDDHSDHPDMQGGAGRDTGPERRFWAEKGVCSHLGGTA